MSMETRPPSREPHHAAHCSPRRRFSFSYVPLCARMAHAVRAILLARATATTLPGRRSWIAFCHSPGTLV